MAQSFIVDLIRLKDFEKYEILVISRDYWWEKKDPPANEESRKVCGGEGEESVK